MTRVARALEVTRPSDAQIVHSEREADVLVLHVIGPESVTYREDKPCAVVQYCTGVGDRRWATWQPLWNRAIATWSYYDLHPVMPTDATFYHAPLGLDDAFRKPFDVHGPRDLGVLTSGFVAGPGAEAIEEMTIAADRMGWNSMHLGPRPTNMSKRTKVSSVHGISDDQLAGLYRRTRYVSGLRFVEGFEMPAMEGLAQGARPVMFDRPEARRWFNDYAIFVPECHGEQLVEELLKVFRAGARRAVTDEEAEQVRRTFDWNVVAAGFWDVIMREIA